MVKCPHCKEEINHLLVRAMATAYAEGRTNIVHSSPETGKKPMLDYDLETEFEIDHENIFYSLSCPECEEELFSSDTEGDALDFLIGTTEFLETNPNNPHPPVGLPSLFEGGE